MTAGIWSVAGARLAEQEASVFSIAKFLVELALTTYNADEVTYKSLCLALSSPLASQHVLAW